MSRTYFLCSFLLTPYPIKYSFIPLKSSSFSSAEIWLAKIAKTFQNFIFKNLPQFSLTFSHDFSIFLARNGFPSKRQSVIGQSCARARFKIKNRSKTQKTTIQIRLPQGTSTSSCSVVVITFASHAKGLRFEPGQEHAFFNVLLIETKVFQGVFFFHFKVLRVTW